MKTLVATLFCAAGLALGGVAQAAQISTPVIYGALAQDRMHCTVLNGGTKVAVTLKLVNEFGVTEGTYNCGSMIPGDFCSLSRPIDPTAAYACSATAGNVSNLRGSLVIEESVWDAVWWTFFLRPIRSAPMR
jgi:hypothetical protein